jgi:hypothetical protein
MDEALARACLERGWRAFALAGDERVHLLEERTGRLRAVPPEALAALAQAPLPPEATIDALLGRERRP